MSDKIEMKQGLTYISDRGSQLRYSNNDGKEQWLQQVSRYKALETIKRGQPVSIATAEQFDTYAKTASTVDGVLNEDTYNSYVNDPDSYIVLTDTTTHLKCIGLALEPANIGDDIHVLPFGKFVFDTDYEALHVGKEYNPNFTYDDVGKRVYVKFPETEGAGVLTVDEEETLTHYHNIICIGYLTDAPQATTTNGKTTYIGTTTTVEISISGDYRGPVDSTQFEGVLGEDVYIKENDPVRLFAFGKEEDTKFKATLRLTPQNGYKDSDGNAIKPFTNQDFIAIQKLDGTTAFIYPKIFDDSGAWTNETFDTTAPSSDDDTSFIHMSNVYKSINGISSTDGCIPVILNDYQTADGVNSNITNLKVALGEAFKYVSGFDYDMTSVSPTGTDYYGTITLESTENGGYFDIYISTSMLSKFDGTYVYSNGSYANKGTVVLADIRIPERRDLIGIYNGSKFGKLEKGYSTVFMRMGEYTLPDELDSTVPFIDGGNYYLGFNGRLTRWPYNQYDYVNKVAYQKEKNKLVIDVGKSTCHYNGDFPVGYMKPAIADNDGTSYHAEFGFLLMDGTTTYPIEKPYETIYTRLKGWFSESDVDVSGTSTFVVPKVFRPMPSDTAADGQVNVPMQIKYLADGIYEEMPRIPFIRKFGQFKSEAATDSTTSDTTPIKPIIDDIDITSIIDYGIEKTGYAAPDVSNLNIHLFVDPNPDYTSGAHDWHEVKEGFFNYNNTTTYGFTWKINTYEPNAFDAPYGKYTISTDVGDGEGIAYVTGKNSAPLKLNNCYYKIYVSRYEYFPRQFDIEKIYKDYISNSVYTDETESEIVINKAVSGKAVLDAIKNKLDISKLIVNKDAIIRLGTEDAQVSELSLVSANDIPIVSTGGKVILANGFDDTTLNTVAPKVIVEKGQLKTENADATDIYASDSTKDYAYNVDENNIPTVKQVRTHAERTIDGLNFAKNYANKTNKTGGIHGMIFGAGGNVDASTVDGVRVAQDNLDILTDVGNFTGAYIPFTYKRTTNDSYTTSHEGIDLYVEVDSGATKPTEVLSESKYTYNNYKVVSTDGTVNVSANIISVIRNSKNGYLQRVKKSSGNGAFDTYYNFAENRIEFYSTDSSATVATATLYAGAFTQGSLSKYKKIYGELLRSDLYSKDSTGTQTTINWTDLASDSVKYTSDTNKFNTVLGSALQAAYELPMAYWQYNTEKDWYKKTMGFVVERVNDVAGNFNTSMSRNLFDNLNLADYKNNSFTYTDNEVSSIKEYLTSVIDNSSTGVNITDVVGLLTKAAKETQERLLKVEASTFGGDYSTIPGGRDKYVITGMDGVVPDPTNYGLNRLIRAICLELYNTANPFDSDSLNSDSSTTTSLSRIDTLDRDIHGKTNLTTSTTSENDLGIVVSTTYPYNDIVNNTDVTALRKAESSETESTTAKLGIGVNTRIDMENPSSVIATDKTHFNGIVDALYRITTKLNALTESVNGTDNIANAPLRLNTIRQNIEHIIRESYFDDKYNIEETASVDSVDTLGTKIVTKTLNHVDETTYSDLNTTLNTPYDKTLSRADRITDSLYNFIVSNADSYQEFGGFTKFGDETNSDGDQVYITGRQFNGKNLLTDTSAAKGDASETSISSHIPQNLNDYTYATLLDIVVDAIGEESYRKNTVPVNGATDADKVKDTYRHNRTISSRLDNIETALDNVVLKLSRRKHFENDTDGSSSTSNFDNVYSIDNYMKFLNEYLGYNEIMQTESYSDSVDTVHSGSFANGVDGNGIVEKDGKTDDAESYTAEYAFQAKKKIHAGLVNTLYRLQNEESKSDKLDKILGSEFNTEASTITQTITDYVSDDTDGQRTYTTESTYNLSDDIADILKTLYGTDDATSTSVPTKYSHRTLITDNGNVATRFVKGDGGNNIVDKIVNELYYLPQPVIASGTNSTTLTDVSTSDKDSRYSSYYNFDVAKYFYDIPSGERAITDNNRNEFFNDIGRGTDPFLTTETGKTAGAKYRKSRFEIIETEIRKLRAFLGLNLDNDTSKVSGNSDKINLKFNDILKFTGEGSKSEFNGFTDSDAKDDYDQYNTTSTSTNVLRFILNNDKSNRLLRTEIGYTTNDGYGYYYDSINHNIVAQPDSRKTLYDRVYTLENAMVSDDKWQDNVKSVSAGTGNIFSIVRYLGNLTWDSSKSSLTRGALDTESLTLASKSVTTKYADITSEINGHHIGIQSIFDIIGTDDNTDIATTLVDDVTKARSTKKCDTLWARLNAVETLNTKDLDITNVVSGTFINNALATTMLTKDNALATSVDKTSYLISFIIGGDGYSTTVTTDNLTNTVGDYTVTYNVSAKTISVTKNSVVQTVSSYTVAIGTDVIASKSYVDSAVANAKYTIENTTYGDKKTATTTAYTYDLGTDYPSTKSPVSINNSDELTENTVASGKSIVNVVSAINTVGIDTTSKLNTLYKKLGYLAEYVGTDYASLTDTTSNIGDRGSLLKWD